MSLAQRFLIPLKDTLRYSPAGRSALGRLNYLRAVTRADPSARAAGLAKALTQAGSEAAIATCTRALSKSPGFENEAVWLGALERFSRYPRLVKRDPLLTRSVVLKSPNESGEKGVLLMTFEYNWARLFMGIPEPDFRWIDERYDLILSTSWSPTDYALLGLALARVKGTVFVQSCNHGEIRAIEGLHPRIKCLPTLPCDWINPALYEPKPFAERRTDIVMVANWGEFKRHWELFAALAKMPRDLKVVLIGQREPGRSRDDIRQLARVFGAHQEIQIHESISIAQVAAQQCDAKVSLILTRREGCCVAAVESLFAGCALAMRADAHVGPLAYINEHTGRRLRPGHIAEDLMTLLNEIAHMEPQNWAAENLACHVSWGKLNALLKAEAQGRDLPWTADIAQPQWRPHPTFADEAEREALRPAYAELHRRFPKVFPTDLITESWR